VNGHVEGELQVGAQRRGADAQVLGVDVVQRAPRPVGDSLGRQRLAGARGTREQGDETLALSDNDILHGAVRVVVLVLFAGDVILDKGQDEILLPCIIHEVRKGLLIPIDRLDYVNVKRN
jgi:hypothetical protein